MKVAAITWWASWCCSCIFLFSTQMYFSCHKMRESLVTTWKKETIQISNTILWYSGRQHNNVDIETTNTNNTKTKVHTTISTQHTLKRKRTQRRHIQHIKTENTEYRHTDWWEGFMKYAVEMCLGAKTYIPILYFKYTVNNATIIFIKRHLKYVFH
jgi:translation elongation factor P/translation initiation factor 5A